MAENKKGFVLYADQKLIFDLLTNEEAGILIKHIFSYVNDENPTLNDRLIDMAFNPIKLQLKRDLVKYDGIKERNSANARKRWDATASSGIPKHTKNADKDKGIDKDKVKDINKRKIFFKDSQSFDKSYFKNCFPDWNKEKLAFYYDSLNTWSNEGNKKVDWIATARIWANRDEKQGKINFNQNKQHNHFSNGII
jgi:hypothetical protein